MPHLTAITTYANYKEDPSKYSRGHRMQHGKQRPSHGSNQRQAHEKVRNALLDYSSSFHDWSPNFRTLALRGGYYDNVGFVNG